MLEQQLLVLRLQPTATSQTVVEAGTGAPLGFSRWRKARTWFQRLFVGDVLEVHEHEDEPLLFTVRRCWSFAARSLVWDADDMPVGVLDGTQLLDRLGRLFSVRQREGDRVVFRTTTGCTVAEASPMAETVRLSFHSVVENQPFAKMLLLAAVLSVQ
jgi:hypothetical protein